jgi:hypothetical protein
MRTAATFLQYSNSQHVFNNTSIFIVHDLKDNIERLL